MYWYIILNGTKLPTPYENLDQVYEAVEELRARLCGPVIDWVWE